MRLFGSSLPKVVKEEVEKIDRKIITDPQNIDLFLDKVTVLFYYDETKEARKAMDSALEIDPNNFRCLYTMATLFMYDKKKKEALDYANRIIDTHEPDIEKTQELIGHSYIRRCLDLALFWSDRASLLGQDEIEWKTSRADTLIQFGKFKESLPFLDEILDKDPENLHAINFKGDALRKMGKNKQAIEVYDIAVDLNENYYALNGIGFALTKSGKPKDAESYHRRVLDANPDNIIALNGLGYALTNYKEFLRGKNRQNEALAYFEKSLELDSTYPDTWIYLAELYGSKGKFHDEGKSLECWSNAAPLDLTEYANDQYRKKTGSRKRDKAFRFGKNTTRLGLYAGFKVSGWGSK